VLRLDAEERRRGIADGEHAVADGATVRGEEQVFLERRRALRLQDRQIDRRRLRGDGGLQRRAAGAFHLDRRRAIDHVIGREQQARLGDHESSAARTDRPRRRRWSRRRRRLLLVRTALAGRTGWRRTAAAGCRAAAIAGALEERLGTRSILGNATATVV